jgi:hypothetical protein
MLSPRDESPVGENRKWNAGRRARPQAEGGASRLTPWRVPHAACAGITTMRLPAFRSPFYLPFLSSSLPGSTRQSMRKESSIGFADKAFRTAIQHGPPGQARR